MATLSSIGYNLLSGVCVTAASCLVFGGIVNLRYCNDKIAPRTSARPTSVIQNALHRRRRKYNAKYLAKKQGDGDDSDGSDDEDDEGDDSGFDWACYWFAWIPWAWSLTDREMYCGIPGTGTRAGGRSGTLLKVNLDGIILARFQALCLRVCFLATFLCAAVLLPLNLTAGIDVGRAERNQQLCEDGQPEDTELCEKINVLSDFQQTTLANIPSLADPSSRTYYTLTEDTRLLTRLFAIVLVACILYTYTGVQLWREWVENLALRRVFYLEQDHWKQRMMELEQLRNIEEEEEPFQKILPPWIPHPELRETIPNVAALNSVLYELPEKPVDTEVDDSVGGGWMGTGYLTKRDWQLAKAAKFFDSCIPNQPGFSSSVAAVTILPEANLLANTWKKWILAGQKVRRARYIKQQIAERLYELNKNGKLDESDPIVKEARGVAIPLGIEREGLSGYHLTDYGRHAKEFAHVNGKSKATKNSEIMPDSNETRKNASLRKVSKVDNTLKAIRSESFGASVDTPLVSNVTDHESKDGGAIVKAPENERPTLQSVDKTEFGYSQVLGIHSSGEGLVHHSTTDMHAASSGFEQTAAYSRAFSESAGGCCPRGHFTWNLRRANLKQLLDYLKDTEEDVCEANERLAKARDEVSNFVKGETSKSKSERNVSRLVAIIADHSDDEESASSSSCQRFDPGTQQRIETMQQWDKVDSIVGQNRRNLDTAESSDGSSVIVKACNRVMRSIHEFLFFFRTVSLSVCTASRRPTYAAVTFTSRQSAIAARQCLADGSALGRWQRLEGIPVAPLADSPSCNICTQYGICRPVTVAISNGEKMIRRSLAQIILALMYCFYTIPLSYATGLLSPERIQESLPFLEDFRGGVLAGSASFLSGSIYTVFFFTCPFVFRAIANFGSGAISVREAEYAALQYYWWFMLLTAFTGSSLTTMVVDGFSTGVNIGREFQIVLVSVANVLPGQVSAAWISWIIVKTTITMPLTYLCHANTFIMECFRLKCCSRLSRGKAGGPIPFRVFVDTGVVNLCVLALAPACPLVAPIALVYFIFSYLIFKWSLIFVYRPQYDDGGRRWPQLFNMMISSMVLSQMLLTTMLALKKAAIPALLCGLSIIPTIYFDLIAKKKFMPAYLDAGLLQTSQLDGWGSKRSSAQKRDDYRRWIVDCHKASFVPPCLAGADNNLTAEPAAVVPLEYDEEIKEERKSAKLSQRPTLARSTHHVMGSKRRWSEEFSKRQSSQRGVILRRVTQVLNPRKQTATKNQDEPENMV